MDMSKLKTLVNEAVVKSSDRLELWNNILNQVETSTVCEVGVWKGEFSKYLMDNITGLKEYIFVDPWQNLPNWNKPANVSSEKFELIRNEAFENNKEHLGLIREIRKTTKEAVLDIDKESIDFAYIDGDHTLRGITIDLISILPRIKKNGIVGGDDFTKTIWQHPDEFDPTQVFPFAVYFAEANDLTIFTLPFNQFLIVKNDHFEVVDLANYASLSLKQIYLKRKDW